MKFKDFLEVLDPESWVDTRIHVGRMPFSHRTCAETWLLEDYLTFWNLEIVNVFVKEGYVLVTLKGEAKF